jgi:hypothetical protein
MPIAGVLITILTAFASSFLARIVLGAGLAYFTYNWVEDFVANAQVQMQGLFNNLPSDLLGLISILKVPQALSVVMSALGIAAFVKASKIFLGRASS